MSHESESAASLVIGEQAKVPFHGLLTKKENIRLQRSSQLGQEKIFSKDEHPFHDSNSNHDETSDCSRIEGIAMSMPYTILVTSEKQENTISRIANQIFENSNKLLNGWNSKSEISGINSSKAGRKLKISEDMMNLFRAVDEVHDLTNGRFDPTSGVLSAAFENCIVDKGRPPLPAEVKPYKHAIGWKRRVERSKGKVIRSNENTVIDLDGMSKGYVVDLIVGALLKEGFKNCYVDWAGDIRAVGSHPSGRPWRSAVMLPPDLSRVFQNWKDGTLRKMLTKDDIGFLANFSFSKENGTSINDCSIATSGDYFEVKKYGFHHIAQTEKLTIMKANQASIGTVCVAAKNCVIADALSTAAMTFGTLTESISFLHKLQVQKSDDVYGYCVVGRRRENNRNESEYSKNIFEPLSSSINLNATSDENADEALVPRKEYALTDNDINAIKRCTTGITYRFTAREQYFETDNFTACSMDPEQLIHFLVPFKYLENVSIDSDTTDNKLSCEVINPGSYQNPSKTRLTGTKIDILCKKIIPLGELAFVVASVENVDLENAIPIMTKHEVSSLSEKTIELGLPRSKFKFLPVVDKTKAFFRNMPSAVWVVSTHREDGKEIAFTATSASISSAAMGKLCLNVAHSSAFFAFFGGDGATLSAYMLGSEQKEIATYFVTNSVLEPEMKSSLVNKCVFSVDCTAVKIENVQDHLLIIATVENVETKRAEESIVNQLIWQNRSFSN